MDPLAIGARRAPGMGSEDTLCSRAGCSLGPRKSLLAFCRRSGSEADVALDEMEKVRPLPPGIEKPHAGAERPDSTDKIECTSSLPSRRRVLCRLNPPDEVAALRSFGGEETCRRLVSSMICGIRSEGTARPLPFASFEADRPE